jgi:poly(3-hydroxyalkanoate) synthetase
VRGCASLYLMPYEFPPWEPGYRYTQRWIQEGCIEVVLNGLHLVVRVTQGRKGGISIGPDEWAAPVRQREGSLWRAWNEWLDGHSPARRAVSPSFGFSDLHNTTLTDTPGTSFFQK